MLPIKDTQPIKMPQNQYFLQNLIEMRSHYQSNIEDAERDSNHATEQLAHINALLVDQLVVNQQFTESLLQLRSHYQALRSEHYQKVQSAKEQIAHVNALLADSLVLQHSQQQPISIQAATLEQQALFGAIAAPSEESQKQSLLLAREPKPPEVLEQPITSKDRQEQQDGAIANLSEASPQQNLEVVESPKSPQVSEPQIPTDSHQGQDEEKQSLPEPEPIEALEAQIPTDFHQVEQQPELEPPTELPDVEDSPSDTKRSLLSKPATSPSSRHAALLKTPLLPQYQHLTKSEAVEQLLQEEEGKVLHVNYIIRALHGELTPSDADAEKPRMLETLKKGVAKGLWDRVPDSPGYYTIDMKLVDSEAEPKKVEEKKPQGRKPNSRATEKMLPRYRNSTFTDAVESVMRDHSGEIFTSDIMARALYSDLEGQDLVEARNKIGKIMWSGANQGRWQSVPGQKGAYTLQLGS